MKLFYEDEYVKLIQGDCLEVMDNMFQINGRVCYMESNSINRQSYSHRL